MEAQQILWHIARIHLTYGHTDLVHFRDERWNLCLPNLWWICSGFFYLQTIFDLIIISEILVIRAFMSATQNIFSGNNFSIIYSYSVLAQDIFASRYLMHLTSQCSFVHCDVHASEDIKLCYSPFYECFDDPTECRGILAPSHTRKLTYFPTIYNDANESSTVGNVHLTTTRTISNSLHASQTHFRSTVH